MRPIAFTAGFGLVRRNARRSRLVRALVAQLDTGRGLLEVPCGVWLCTNLPHRAGGQVAIAEPVVVALRLIVERLGREAEVRPWSAGWVGRVVARPLVEFPLHCARAGGRLGRRVDRHTAR